MQPIQAQDLIEAVNRVTNSQERQLAWEFFVFFSRFEYALKRDSRYLRSGVGKAEPNWDRFASDFNSSFDKIDDAKLLAAINFYKSRPPKKQIRDNGKLSWSEPLFYDQTTPLLIWLLLAIRHVRNNLFHGGKFPRIPIEEPSRDHQLVSHAIYILATCLNLDHGLAMEFMRDFD